MVGGLVEQKHVGLLKQNLGQLDAHAPTAAELARGPAEVGAGKAQAHERTLHLGLATLGPEHHVALVLGRESLDQLEVVVALVIGALRQLAVERIDALPHLGDRRKRLARLIYHGGVVLQLHHLRQVTYCGVIGNSHHPIGGLLHTTKNLQHG